MVKKRAADRESPAEVVPLLPGDPRPPPPPDMSPKEAELWRMVVGAMPVGWFSRETHPVLRGLCRQVVVRDDVWWPRYWAALQDPGSDLRELKRLSKLFGAASAEVRRASADLRLTRMARIARGPLQHQHPWG